MADTLACQIPMMIMRTSLIYFSLILTYEIKFGFGSKPQTMAFGRENKYIGMFNVATDLQYLRKNYYICQIEERKRRKDRVR